MPEDLVGEGGEEALEDRVRRRSAAARAERAKPNELDAGCFKVGLPRAGALDLCYEIGGC